MNDMPYTTFITPSLQGVIIMAEIQQAERSIGLEGYNTSAVSNYWTVYGMDK